MIDLLIDIDQYLRIKDLKDQSRPIPMDSAQTAKYYNSLESLAYEKEKSGRPIQATPKDGWKCSKCGAANAIYVGTCGCGQLKKENNTKKRTSSAKVTDSDSKEVDNLQQLKLCKELLDMGAITQEEFDAKKKQLLGL